jgi:hypothetical protein
MLGACRGGGRTGRLSRLEQAPTIARLGRFGVQQRSADRRGPRWGCGPAEPGGSKGQRETTNVEVSGRFVAIRLGGESRWSALSHGRGHGSVRLSSTSFKAGQRAACGRPRPADPRPDGTWVILPQRPPGTAEAARLSLTTARVDPRRVDRPLPNDMLLPGAHQPHRRQPR